MKSLVQFSIVAMAFEQPLNGLPLVFDDICPLAWSILYFQTTKNQLEVITWLFSFKYDEKYENHPS